MAKKIKNEKEEVEIDNLVILNCDMSVAKYFKWGVSNPITYANC